MSAYASSICAATSVSTEDAACMPRFARGGCGKALVERRLIDLGGARDLVQEVQDAHGDFAHGLAGV